jgi:two-component system, NarL family, response regulator NreC
MQLAAARHEGRTIAAPRAVLWLLANPIDCDALGLWCKTHVSCDVVETAAELDAGLRRCELMQPRLLALDPTIGEAAMTRAVAALRAGFAGHLLVFDRRPREGRLVDLLDEPGVSYLSRAMAPRDLASAIEGLLDHGARAIDPALAPRLRRTSRGYEFRQSTVAGSVAGLSLRERQVMRLLALGKSVGECAEALGLAHSTIDNHKSRLMKKLNLHKASELTCRAIREGLIAL